MLPRRFALVRHVDYTGVSGVGVVAYGVVFGDGQVALRWSSTHPATSLWASLDDLMAVHGHGDATSIEWLDPAADPFGQPAHAPPRLQPLRPAPEQRSAPAPAPAPSPAPAPQPDPAPDREPEPTPATAPPAEPDPSTADTAPQQRITGRRARRVAVETPGPPPPPDGNGGWPPHARVPSQRRTGRHRRSMPDQEARASSPPIERDAP
ncbi:hypothetical protein [Jiangella asiatica]|uniref:hypothetical protein n=1 Tax=Jiangella asiatica TaxID=2530372 RepID=UPI00193D4343|nr:hypothetical protein [Jiangella asiatica]